MTPSLAPSQSSLLLWGLGVLVYLMGLHVTLDAVRAARHSVLQQPPPRLWPLAAMAAVACGTSLCVGFVLGVAGLPLPYTLGFQPWAAAGLWLVACGGALAGFSVLVHRAAPGLHAATGALMGLLALGLQAGWLGAAGLRPGLAWQPAVLGAAGALMALGLAAALHTALGVPATSSRLRVRWRVAGTVFATLAVLGGQELLLAGLRVPAQVGSVYRHQLSLSLLSLVGGTLVPLLLAVAALDLRATRRERRERSNRRSLGL